MTCFLPRSKGDRQALGITYEVPTLSRLCPMTAIADWTTTAALTEVPLFRGVDRWGVVSDSPLHPSSMIPSKGLHTRNLSVISSSGNWPPPIRRPTSNWPSSPTTLVNQAIGWRWHCC
jgi:hypothetical protein